MLFGLQARHGCVRNVDGEGDEKSLRVKKQRSGNKFNFYRSFDFILISLQSHRDT